MLLQPAIRAWSQLDDPVFLGVVLRSVGWTVLSFIALAELLSVGGHEAALDWGANLNWSRDPEPAEWLGWLGYAAGPIGAGLLALVLFLPLACVIATLFLDRVAVAVERAWYPEIVQVAPAPFSHQLWDGLELGLKVLLLQLLALLLSLVLPGVGLLLGWFIAAWAIGRGLFVQVAMRHMGRREAMMLCRQRMGAVLAQGGWVAALALVPVANLMAPILGTAALVHVLNAPVPVYRYRL